LANLATKDGLIVLAGNGSSVEDRLKGNDTHFKAFEARLTNGSAGSLAFLSKTQLFTPPKADNAKKEQYQRVLRLSPPQRTGSSTPNKRIGAIASGLGGDENEIVVFSATSTRPQAQDIIKRIKLSKGQEANDLDIWDQGEGRFQVAYALDGEVYLQDVDFDFAKSMSRTENERRKAYTVPHPDASERKAKSKIRSVRWLSPKHLILLANKPNRTGVELLVLHMYEEGPGSIVSRKTLSSHVKAATDFDVALLDADSEGAYQAVVAVAGIDISLSVYTIDYLGTAQDSLSQLHKYATYDDVSITRKGK
jgi:prolactin regulatory element-binding protein